MAAGAAADQEWMAGLAAWLEELLVDEAMATTRWTPRCARMPPAWPGGGRRAPSRRGRDARGGEEGSLPEPAPTPPLPRPLPLTPPLPTLIAGG